MKVEIKISKDEILEHFKKELDERGYHAFKLEIDYYSDFDTREFIGLKAEIEI
jgi:hypothetical protein